MVFIKPTGKIIRGHVLDCAVGPLVERLRDYDPQLYVRWNPKKLRGWGLWEVRRRPNLKSVKDAVKYKGVVYQLIDYVENDFESHVIDVPFLNYDIILKLKDMDTWTISTDAEKFSNEMDYRDKQSKEKIEADANSERRYAIKQHKSMVRDLMDYTLSGGDPSRIANYWPKA